MRAMISLVGQNGRWGHLAPGVDPSPSLAALRESVAILESLVAENPWAIRYRTPLTLAYQYTGLCLRDIVPSPWLTR